MFIKDFIKRLSNIGLEVNYSLDNGLSIAGMNFTRARHSYANRSQIALDKCLRFNPFNVLDVGSGGGYHAAVFAESGANVTCIDFGTSIYAVEAKSCKGVNVVEVDFSLWTPDQQYDLVWASHVLEHQRNIGFFLDKMISCCKPQGKVAITVPFPHRKLWGGHLTLWTPGLLAYNVVLCGIDLSNADVLYGYRETSIIFQPKMATLPTLTYDSGDLDKLKPYLPSGFGENTDSWF
jgi:SAM-dependent methyltransferase